MHKKTTIPLGNLLILSEFEWTTITVHLVFGGSFQI